MALSSVPMENGAEFHACPRTGAQVIRALGQSTDFRRPGLVEVALRDVRSIEVGHARFLSPETTSAESIGIFGNFDSSFSRSGSGLEMPS